MSGGMGGASMVTDGSEESCSLFGIRRSAARVSSGGLTVNERSS